MIVVIITGYGSVDTAVTSMKEGASDYIVKPLDTADKIKNNPVTILINGESGTGKEILARYIHFTSNRKDAQFVSINCAALSENLLLSELFGHEKGAFTGAIERKLVKFEIADGGTLFLDEIADMPLDIQGKLLRVMEESAFERVGGVKRIYVDVRIIAATNKDLQQLIVSGKFREDLYYRINVVNFHLPPLRERKDDISLLINHFIQKYNFKYKKNIKSINHEEIKSIASYEWPGNVRELENVVNQAVLLGDGPVISIYRLKSFSFSREKENTISIDISKVKSLKQVTEEISGKYEKHIIAMLLAQNSCNKSKTARELAITRKTLARKIEKYKL
ncbi:MAG: sigma-54 dependent transcriptional regulator [Spirochaetota bacterium]